MTRRCGDDSDEIQSSQRVKGRAGSVHSEAHIYPRRCGQYGEYFSRTARISAINCLSCPSMPYS